MLLAVIAWVWGPWLRRRALGLDCGKEQSKNENRSRARGVTDIAFRHLFVFEDSVPTGRRLIYSTRSIWQIETRILRLNGPIGRSLEPTVWCTCNLLVAYDLQIFLDAPVSIARALAYI